MRALKAILKAALPSFADTTRELINSKSRALICNPAIGVGGFYSLYFSETKTLTFPSVRIFIDAGNQLLLQK